MAIIAYENHCFSQPSLHLVIYATVHYMLPDHCLLAVIILSSFFYNFSIFKTNFLLTTASGY